MAGTARGSDEVGHGPRRAGAGYPGGDRRSPPSPRPPAAGGRVAGGGGSGGKGSITVYSGQHQQTATLLANDFTRPDRRHRQPPLERRGRPGQPDPPRGGRLAGRRLLRREPAGADRAQRQGAPGRRSTRPRSARVAGPLQLAPRRLGRRLGPRRPCSSTTPPSSRRPPCPAQPAGPRRPGLEGQDRLRPDRDRLPAADHRARQAQGPAGGGRAGCNGLKANGKVYDSNETLVAAVNRGEVAAGLIDHYYWYRLRDEVGAGKVTLGPPLLRRRRPRRPGRRLGGGGAQVEQPPGARPALPRLPGQPAGPGDHRPQRELRVPARLGGHDGQARLRPFAELHPPAVSIDDLGDGRASLMLLQQVGLI